MKHVLIVIALAGLITSCDNVSGFLNSTSSDSAKITSATPVYQRDMSITSENSYSDLFLDSAAVESYIQSEKLDDSAARDLRNFYYVRNYQYAWFNSEGFTEQGRGFWSLYDENSEANKTSDKSLKRTMDTLVEVDTLSVSATDSSFTKTELGLTQQFLSFSKAKKEVSPVFADPYHAVPVRKMDVMQLADSILNKNKDSAAFATNQSYQQLKKYLRKYYTAAQDSSWQTIPSGVNALRKSKSSPMVPIIKQHLQLTGDYSGTDTSQVYNDSLAVAIKSYKQRNGFDSTDAITDSVIKTLNVSPKERLEQIVVNLNRMQWMPQVKKENMIEVNIPTFMLNVYEANKKAFDMKVVVGKEGSNTMMFNGDLNQIVFSPYWNVPESIVKDEIMPAMKSDRSYLKKKNMEIVKKNDSVPVIRQLPGKDNSLGRVKFLFPNTYDIFFHDTPAKGLFEQDKRAFSHGCIRLEDPVKLATYLLKDDPSWTPEKIQQAMNSGKEQFVKLKNSMPVSITYYTAWVDENGGLNFREDVYGQDKKTAAHLFTNAAYLQTPASMDSTNKKDTGRMRS